MVGSFVTSCTALCTLSWLGFCVIGQIGGGKMMAGEITESGLS